MPGSPSSRPPAAGWRRDAASRRAVRRRRLAAVALLAFAVLVIAVIAVRSTGAPAGTVRARPGEVVLRDGERVVATVALDRYARSGRLDGAGVRRAVRAALPVRAVLRSGRSTVAYRRNVAAAARKAVALGAGGGTVQVQRAPTSSAIRAPVVRQALRNNCESAALEILLATTGRRVDQLQLQERLPRSGALDPVETPEGRVWGDPEEGYVGRAEGGGAAGGFGVYQRPVMEVARAYGRRLEDLGGRAQPVYDALLEGRAVMVWIGLSDGPYGEWRSPSGRPVEVNFGEHTVVLAGIRADGMLRVVNPLEGTRELWTRDQFETKWARLGRRAIAA